MCSLWAYVGGEYQGFIRGGVGEHLPSLNMLHGPKFSFLTRICLNETLNMCMLLYFFSFTMFILCCWVSELFKSHYV